jgi:hypothetical protein
MQFASVVVLATVFKLFPRDGFPIELILDKLGMTGL